MMRRRRKILKVKEIQGFFEVCFRYDKEFSRPPRYDRFGAFGAGRNNRP